ncbi:antibiotic biosynthesis monooxygenase [Nocardia sp. 004]|uniref:antibiotic biosynthesis monooxygenase n=1 Tax=Nocardia sp. 004 TaxID=3385978 RepID=UPI0039A1A15C
MYARSSTFVAQPSAIDKGVTYLRDEGMPNLSEFEGWVGLSMLVDRSTGRCIATTAWESETALHASSDRVQSIRERLARTFDGRLDRVEEWEIALMHRGHPAGENCRARCTWVQVDPDRLDRLIDTFKNEALPQTERLDGFRSASLFVDRATGRAVTAIVWANEEALEASREPAIRTRAAATQRLSINVLEVGEFDLAFAHLRVPEMA